MRHDDPDFCHTKYISKYVIYKLFPSQHIKTILRMQKKFRHPFQ